VPESRLTLHALLRSACGTEDVKEYCNRAANQLYLRQRCIDASDREMIYLTRGNYVAAIRNSWKLNKPALRSQEHTVTALAWCMFLMLVGSRYEGIELDNAASVRQYLQQFLPAEIDGASFSWASVRGTLNKQLVVGEKPSNGSRKPEKLLFTSPSLAEQMLPIWKNEEIGLVLQHALEGVEVQTIVALFVSALCNAKPQVDALSKDRVPAPRTVGFVTTQLQTMLRAFAAPCWLAAFKPTKTAAGTWSVHHQESQIAFHFLRSKESENAPHTILVAADYTSFELLRITVDSEDCCKAAQYNWLQAAAKKCTDTVVADDARFVIQHRDHLNQLLLALEGATFCPGIRQHEAPLTISHYLTANNLVGVRQIRSVFNVVCAIAGSDRLPAGYIVQDDESADGSQLHMHSIGCMQVTPTGQLCALCSKYKRNSINDREKRCEAQAAKQLADPAKAALDMKKINTAFATAPAGVDVKKDPLLVNAPPASKRNALMKDLKACTSPPRPSAMLLAHLGSVTKLSHSDSEWIKHVMQLERGTLDAAIKQYTADPTGGDQNADARKLLSFWATNLDKFDLLPDLEERERVLCGVRYPVAVIKFAANMHRINKGAYEDLRSTFLLPSTSTMKTLAAAFDINGRVCDYAAVFAYRTALRRFTEQNYGEGKRQKKGTACAKCAENDSSCGRCPVYCYVQIDEVFIKADLLLTADGVLRGVLSAEKEAVIAGIAQGTANHVAALAQAKQATAVSASTAQAEPASAKKMKKQAPGAAFNAGKLLTAVDGDSKDTHAAAPDAAETKAIAKKRLASLPSNREHDSSKVHESRVRRSYVCMISAPGGQFEYIIAELPDNKAMNSDAVGAWLLYILVELEKQGVEPLLITWDGASVHDCLMRTLSRPTVADFMIDPTEEECSPFFINPANGRLILAFTDSIHAIKRYRNAVANSGVDKLTRVHPRALKVLLRADGTLVSDLTNPTASATASAIGTPATPNSASAASAAATVGGSATPTATTAAVDHAMNGKDGTWFSIHWDLILAAYDATCRDSNRLFHDLNHEEIHLTSTGKMREAAAYKVLSPSTSASLVEFYNNDDMRKRLPAEKRDTYRPEGLLWYLRIGRWLKESLLNWKFYLKSADSIQATQMFAAATELYKWKMQLIGQHGAGYGDYFIPHQLYTDILRATNVIAAMVGLFGDLTDAIMVDADKMVSPSPASTASGAAAGIADLSGVTPTSATAAPTVPVKTTAATQPPSRSKSLHATPKATIAASVQRSTSVSGKKPPPAQLNPQRAASPMAPLRRHAVSVLQYLQSSMVAGGIRNRLMPHSLQLKTWYAVTRGLEQEFGNLRRCAGASPDHFAVTGYFNRSNAAGGARRAHCSPSGNINDKQTRMQKDKTLDFSGVQRFCRGVHTWLECDGKKPAKLFTNVDGIAPSFPVIVPSYTPTAVQSVHCATVSQSRGRSLPKPKQSALTSHTAVRPLSPTAPLTPSRPVGAAQSTHAGSGSSKRHRSSSNRRGRGRPRNVIRVVSTPAAANRATQAAERTQSPPLPSTPLRSVGPAQHAHAATASSKRRRSDAQSTPPSNAAPDLARAPAGTDIAVETQEANNGGASQPTTQQSSAAQTAAASAVIAKLMNDEQLCVAVIRAFEAACQTTHIGGSESGHAIVQQARYLLGLVTHKTYSSTTITTELTPTAQAFARAFANWVVSKVQLMPQLGRTMLIFATLGHLTGSNAPRSQFYDHTTFRSLWTDLVSAIPAKVVNAKRYHSHTEIMDPLPLLPLATGFLVHFFVELAQCWTGIDDLPELEATEVAAKVADNLGANRSKTSHVAGAMSRNIAKHVMPRQVAKFGPQPSAVIGSGDAAERPDVAKMAVDARHESKSSASKNAVGNKSKGANQSHLADSAASLPAAAVSAASMFPAATTTAVTAPGRMATVLANGQTILASTKKSIAAIGTNLLAAAALTEVRVTTRGTSRSLVAQVDESELVDKALRSMERNLDAFDTLKFQDQRRLAELERCTTVIRAAWVQADTQVKLARIQYNTIDAELTHAVNTATRSVDMREVVALWKHPLPYHCDDRLLGLYGILKRTQSDTKDVKKRINELLDKMDEAVEGMAKMAARWSNKAESIRQIMNPKRKSRLAQTPHDAEQALIAVENDMFVSAAISGVAITNVIIDDGDDQDTSDQDSQDEHADVDAIDGFADEEPAADCVASSLATDTAADVDDIPDVPVTSSRLVRRFWAFTRVTADQVPRMQQLEESWLARTSVSTRKIGTQNAGDGNCTESEDEHAYDAVSSGYTDRVNNKKALRSPRRAFFHFFARFSAIALLLVQRVTSQNHMRLAVRALLNDQPSRKLFYAMLQMPAGGAVCFTTAEVAAMHDMIAFHTFMAQFRAHRRTDDFRASLLNRLSFRQGLEAKSKEAADAGGASRKKLKFTSPAKSAKAKSSTGVDGTSSDSEDEMLNAVAAAEAARSLRQGDANAALAGISDSRPPANTEPLPQQILPVRASDDHHEGPGPTSS
jgi:hypothetical protein